MSDISSNDQLMQRFPRTDSSGEVDMEQLEYNLSLTPDQRIDQYMCWLEFMELARQAGRDYYGMETRPAQATK